MFTSLSQAHDVASSLTPFNERHDPLSHRFHHVFVFVGVLMPIIDRSDASFAVVLNPVHGVAAETESGDGGAVSAPEVVRRRFLHLYDGTDLAHRSVEAVDRSSAESGKY